MSSDPSRHICCPECGCRKNYRLGDGRKKCRHCGKKYSCRLLRSRLPVKTLKQLALSFWLMAPVAIVARELHLNPKTVRRHYELIRKGITHAKEYLPVDDDNQELFLFQVTPDAVWATVVTSTSLAKNTCQDNGSDWKYGELFFCEAPLNETVCRVYLPNNAEQQGQPAWLLELEKLRKVVRGVSQKARNCRYSSRRVLMNEVAFRFNHRSDPGAAAILYGFFKN